MTATPSRSRPTRRTLGLLLILAALLLTCAASLAHGSNPLPYAAVWDALWHRGGDTRTQQAEAIVWGQRVPRTVVAVIAGAGFGVSGALIQAITRNPLADPGILGVNAGASFAVTVGVSLFGLSSAAGYVWCAFLGAALATVLVYAIGAAGGGTAHPATLVLAGVALGSVLTGISRFLMLLNPRTFDAIRH